jgi:hypothetical protein
MFTEILYCTCIHKYCTVQLYRIICKAQGGVNTLARAGEGVVDAAADTASFLVSTRIGTQTGPGAVHPNRGPYGRGGHARHTEPGRAPQDDRSTTAWEAVAVLEEGKAGARVFTQERGGRRQMAVAGCGRLAAPA